MRDYGTRVTDTSAAHGLSVRLQTADHPSSTAELPAVPDVAGRDIRRRSRIPTRAGRAFSASVMTLALHPYIAWLNQVRGE